MKKITKSLLSLILVAVVAVMIPVSAFAKSTGIDTNDMVTPRNQSFYEGGDIFAFQTSYSRDFSTGSDNRLTISGFAENVFGNSGRVSIHLQKYVNGGYFDQAQRYVNYGSSATAVFRDEPVERYTTYRLKFTLETNDALGVAHVSLGVGTWEALS